LDATAQNAYLLVISRLTKANYVDWKQCRTVLPTNLNYSTLSSGDTSVKLTVRYRNDASVYFTMEQVLVTLSSDLNAILKKALEDAVGTSRKDAFKIMESRASVFASEPEFVSSQPTPAAVTASVNTSGLSASTTTAIIASTVSFGFLLLLGLALYFLRCLPQAFSTDKVVHVSRDDKVVRVSQLTHLNLHHLHFCLGSRQQIRCVSRT
jgi:hypothetical protein